MWVCVFMYIYYIINSDIYHTQMKKNQTKNLFRNTSIQSNKINLISILTSTTANKMGDFLVNMRKSRSVFKTPSKTYDDNFFGKIVNSF